MCSRRSTVPIVELLRLYDELSYTYGRKTYQLNRTVVHITRKVFFFQPFFYCDQLLGCPNRIASCIYCKMALPVVLLKCSCANTVMTQGFIHENRRRRAFAILQRFCHFSGLYRDNLMSLSKQLLCQSQQTRRDLICQIR